MILFVFEGSRRETEVFRTLESLYFPKKMDRIICSFGNDIYELYRIMTNGQKDYLFYSDLVSILRERSSGKEDNPFASVSDSSQISEIYLFFDYDIHNQNAFKSYDMDVMNNKLKEMLSFFSDETDQGKLYINYPMVESIRYTKELPDENYCDYSVKLEQIGSFKESVNTFSFYKNNDFMSLKFRHGAITRGSMSRLEELKDNWKALNRQNILKANYICQNQKELPMDKEKISQMNVFDSHMKKFFPVGLVPVLNSFPLFLYEYFEILEI